MEKRKQIRLQKYNYAQNGGYFITMCVEGMKCILGKIKPVEVVKNNVGANCVRPQIDLSYVGKIIKNEIIKFDTIYDYVRIDKYVIMPNHIHMIIIIERPDWRTQFAPTIPQMIKQFKGSITKQLGYSIWQRSYYEHVIRNKHDYELIYKYIEENPICWAYDKYYKEGK